MTEAKDIDNIDNIADMFRTMQAFGVSCEGLQTLDEMKNRTKEMLKTSEKASSWTAKEAFSVLTEAKKEDERKRATLSQFYKDTEAFLNSMDDKMKSVLETKIGNLNKTMAINKRKLTEKDYIVLVTGETSSGKSTLLNLILGEELLPYSTLSTTSTICEVKYGPTPKLVAHLKDKDPETGITKKTVWLGQSMESSQKSYLQEISPFVHVKTNREKGSDYNKIELFWPHSLLQQGIVIVDSPGIGEAEIMDNMVKQYFPEAFAFIYVINSTNAGGIQKERVVELIEHAKNVALEQQTETSTREPPARALFVCNKWDQVSPEEVDEVKNDSIKKLTQCWPSLDPDSEVIFMSSKNAREAQSRGIITKEFTSLMNGIKSIVLKSIEARLQTQWRWLDYLLSNMAFHAKAFVHNSHKDRAKVIERIAFITEGIKKIEEEQSSVEKELQEYLENKIDHAVSSLSKYLKSSVVVEQFTLWRLNDFPETTTGRTPLSNWEDTQSSIQRALMKRLQDVIAAWEKEHRVFSNARSSLIQHFQQHFNFVEGKLRNLQGSVLGEDAPSPASDPLASVNFSVFEKVIFGLTSPIWLPVMLVWFIKEQVEGWIRIREYTKEKSQFMASVSQEFLTKAAEEQNLRHHVVEQLKECQVYLKQVVVRIPELIEAEKMLCQQLRDENRSQKEIKDFYKPLYERSLKMRASMALFGIKEVRTMDISCSNLEWNCDEGSLLGTGVFASVYQGTLKQKEVEQPVALKVWKDELNHSNASVFLAEADNLRKLNYPFIVKFYGAALRQEGDQVRGILVMELCKENLMTYIFKNPNNIPGLPSSTLVTERNTIRWAKNIANALEFIHRQGFIHRDLKLENILISQEGVVKIADVGVSKEAKMITGTMTGTPIYVAPEVARSVVYDNKADIYSFGFMMWEMWYGKRAFLDVVDLKTLLEKVAEGVRPSHVEGRKKPLDGWRHLMQSCWDGEADKRPTAAMCHKDLMKLYMKAKPPI